MIRRAVSISKSSTRMYHVLTNYGSTDVIADTLASYPRYPSYSTTTTMSLLQDLLRSQTVDSKIIERKLNSLSVNQDSNPSAADDSEDELIAVVRFLINHPLLTF